MVRKRLDEIGVAALTSLALVAAYLIARAHLSDASDGDWLEFAGAVFGVMGAILVALWIPQIQIRSRDRLAKVRIVETAKVLLRVLDFSELPNIDQARGSWEGVLVSLERIAHERERMTHITHDQFLTIRSIERAVRRMDDRIAQNPDLLDPLTFEFELASDRKLVVNWLGRLETILGD